MEAVVVQEAKLRYLGGEVPLNEELMHKAKDCQQRLLESQGRAAAIYLEQGALLCLVRDEGLALYLQEDYETAGDDWCVTITKSDALWKWAWIQFAWSRSSVERRMIIYENLYQRYTEMFDKWLATGLPDTKRLEYIARKERYLAPEARELLEAAKLPARDWEVVRRTVIAGEDPVLVEFEEALRQNQRIAAAQRRAIPDLVPWSSKDYRRWIRTHRCILTGGVAEACHLFAKGMGSGGQDFCNIVPLCHDVHVRQHANGWEPILHMYQVEWEWILDQAVLYNTQYLLEMEESVKTLRRTVTKLEIEQSQVDLLTDGGKRYTGNQEEKE